MPGRPIGTATAGPPPASAGKSLKLFWNTPCSSVVPSPMTAWPLEIKSRTPGQGNWTVGRGDVRAYAREIANLVDWLGADHVGIGTDIEGVGTSWSVNGYAHVRGVVDALQDLKLPASAVEKVAGGNYARLLRAALSS